MLRFGRTGAEEAMSTTCAPLPETVALQEGDDKDNLLVGTDVDDHLLGHGGNDTLVGNEGSDYLEGGDGDDTLTGDDGSADSIYTGFDDFAFDKDDGTDTITDFQVGCPVCLLLPNTPVDEIILKGGTQADINSLVAGVTASPDGDAVLHYGKTNIVLTGYSPMDVQDYWFTLV
jgi:Ca2+-binding RTX toxin-like protein